MEPESSASVSIPFQTSVVPVWLGPFPWDTMNLARSPREALLWALSDLEENNFKILKLRLQERSLLEAQCQLGRGSWKWGLFDPGEKPLQTPPVAVLQGNAGTGKTTLVRKIMLDWASGKLYPGQFDYVFRIQRQPERLLFILDGSDELQRPFAEGVQRPRQSPMEFMLHCLVKRELLSTSSVLITTRPLALKNLESLLEKPLHVHVLGFSEEERRRYFSSYFTDEEQARSAFDIVQRSDVLYKACQVPAICWVVCSWLKRQMERGQEVSETPSNDTDIFMAYVSTFLPPSDNGASAELTRDRVLKGLCSLAAGGIQHQRFLFEEADLRKHNLDGPGLAPFLSSNDYYQGLDMKKLYSFRHIIFQEFFCAISYLVREDQSKLGEESCREVDRLLSYQREARK
ncbi:NACHT, LRR and PYD domains-containing protein 10 [Galemys pyrenaicus]|uniref:NACHT, LRR and PYD domains-containing protein 10 n=1 Tax=Galemys pyrenaicus TaxID=202257 RepID=A0A8J5ZVE5_GALPY|nr:NACHT, LRR and PYD domains-containing protein 10 [Galemys pyrenaicus]